MLCVLVARGQRPWQMRITYLLRLIHCLIILHQNERFGLTSLRPKLGDRQGLVSDMYKYVILINRQTDKILLKYHRSMKNRWVFFLVFFVKINIQSCLFSKVKCVLRKICRAYKSKSLIRDSDVCYSSLVLRYVSRSSIRINTV